jgi:hypothetical protein
VPAASIETHALGLSWIMDEPLTRTSHALVHEDRVWLIDPVNDPDALAQALALGRPAAVLQLLDRHNRDCASVAGKLGVPHLRTPLGFPDSPFVAVQLMHRKRWREVALWWPRNRALVVAEAVGTAPLFAAGRGLVGVHPLLRLTPPRRLASIAPDHLLVGHGPGVHGADAADQLRRALQRSRRDLPRMLMKLPTLRGG